MTRELPQQHFIKPLIKKEMSFGSLKTARQTLKGYECINVNRNFQVEVVKKKAI